MTVMCRLEDVHVVSSATLCLIAFSKDFPDIRMFFSCHCYHQ